MSEPWEGSNTDAHSAAAVTSTTTASDSGNDVVEIMEERWKRVHSQAQSYKQQKPHDDDPQTDDLLWQSAMNRYTQVRVVCIVNLFIVVFLSMHTVPYMMYVHSLIAVS